ncbi:rhomboid family intramembrane serine protease [Salinimonas chungwhensis]|uniref:rhomboid family intramembrane serine protease n=1 Tax=Salinimonas chungwhensis TaxID=265425 RepID=UPI0003680B76|nr:rhomboid family intramembrane serine protease [Salinimonas chungwhensis]
MKRPPWLLHNIFPLKEKCDHVYNSGLEISDNCEMYKQWQPQQNIVIDSAQYRRKVPPIYCTCYQQPILEKLRKKYFFMIFGNILFFTLFMVFNVYYEFSRIALSWSFIFLLLSLLYINEYKHGMRKIRQLKERGLFYYWFFNDNKARRSVLYCAIIPILFFLLQRGLEGYSGNNSTAFYLYGVMYENVDEGEYWRLATGAFLHYSFFHFLANVFFLAIIGPLCIALTGYASIFIFVAGNISGAFFQYLWGAHELSSCGGISFGIYTLCGFLIGFNCFFRPLFPRGFCASLCIVIATGLIYSEFINENAATTGHLASLITGLFCSVALRALARCQKHKTPVSAND